MIAVVRTTPEADVLIREASRWWHTHREATRGLFDAELVGAISLLAHAPDVGHRYPRRGIPGLRRLLLPRTRYHVYYVHAAARAEVIVLAVWSAVRGRGPALKVS